MNLQERYEQDYAEASQFAVISFMNRVYAWMTLGLAVTGATAWGISTFAPTAFASKGALFALLIASLAVVIGLSAVASRLPAPLAIGGFLFYALLEGAFFSVIFLIYPIALISMTFFVTAGVFGTMAIFGTLTKKDLSGVGSLCFMGLLGIILVFIGQFVFSLFGAETRMLDIPISIFGILIFLGLTAWDSQKIKQMSLAGETSTGLAICGALALYLDFINLFLFLLRLFSASRD
ncbi:MAG: Bax inhibitor-1/YccA family protein [Planctomycetaceae bacterium]|nr:Bax inhibitor-1/YccA family protein [Planctomycetaceae bacterium]